MPGPWFTGDQCYARVTNRLSSQTPADKWVEICNDAANTAYTDLRNILANKGYTPGQMDAWDDRVTYSQDQAMFWAWVNGGQLAPGDEKADKLDRRKELIASVGIMINGVLTEPGADPAVGVGSGSFAINRGGVDYGSTFGLRVNRQNGINQYGDPLQPPEGPGN